MNRTNNNTDEFINYENPFTEIFSLLKHYENLSDGLVTLAYHSDKLQTMYQHINNATDILLQGLNSKSVRNF